MHKEYGLLSAVSAGLFIIWTVLMVAAFASKNIISMTTGVIVCVGVFFLASVTATIVVVYNKDARRGDSSITLKYEQLPSLYE